MSDRHEATGGDCPVHPNTFVRPIYRGAEDPAKGVRLRLASAGRLDWSHDGGPDDIVAYEIQWTAQEGS